MDLRSKRLRKPGRLCLERICCRRLGSDSGSACRVLVESAVSRKDPCQETRPEAARPEGRKLALNTDSGTTVLAGRDAVGPAPRVRSRRSMLGSRRRQVIAGLAIASAIGFLVFEGLGNALSYYQTVPQALAQRGALGTKSFRIMGTVGPTVGEVNHRTVFDISYQGKTVSVVDSADPPQLFKPGIPVVLEGHFAAGSDVFDSDLIMVKHSANYVPAKGEPKSVAAQTGGA